jgi:hypothetical protein
MSSAQARLREVMIGLVSGGWLHAADPQLLMMEFMGPLFLWRQLRAIESPLAVIREPRRFARQHVDQFLRGAASATSDRPRRRVAARRRVGARDAAAEARRTRNAAGRPADKRSSQ